METGKQFKLSLSTKLDNIKILISGYDLKQQINILKNVKSEYYDLLNDFLLKFWGQWQKYFFRNGKTHFLRWIENEIEGAILDDTYEVKINELCNFISDCRQLVEKLTGKYRDNKKGEMWDKAKQTIIKKLGVFIPFRQIESMLMQHSINEKYLSQYDSINDLLNVKIVYLNYLERNQKYNFDNCTFNFNLNMIIEFSMNIESVKDRLIYLKHIEKICNEKKFDYAKLTNEIYKLNNILKLKPNESDPQKIETKAKNDDKPTKASLQEIEIKGQGSLGIMWRTSATDLYYLINVLFPKNDNRKDFLIQRVKTHFTDSNYKPFSKKPITQGTNNLLANQKNKSRKGHKIDLIIQESKTNDKINFEKLINGLIENYFIRETDKRKILELIKDIN